MMALSNGAKAVVDKILYVSDLDGTLLRNDKTISKFTSKALEKMINDGVLFTYATARSYVSASEVIGDLSPRIPSIIYNGTFFRNNDTGEQLLLSKFENGDAQKILSILIESGVYPLVYAYIDGKECYSYVREKLSCGTAEFVLEHSKNDPRDNPVCENELGRGEIFHFTCIEELEKLKPLYEKLKDTHQCVLYKEQYSGKWWLEIHPYGATKANAIRELAKMLGASRIICFGDGVNDISMLEVAHEVYAVENADPELKKIATGVIESNENDGVVRWLINHLKY